MSKYLTLFIEEVEEHLQGMNQAVVALEGDPSSQEHLDTLFRQAHSVKGMAASMGFDDMAALSHALEDMMDDVRSNRRALDTEVSDLLLNGIDLLNAMLSEVADKGEPVSLGEELTRRIRALREQSPAGGTTPAHPAPSKSSGSGAAVEPFVESFGEEPSSLPPGVVSIAIALESDTPVPGARAFLAVKKLEGMGRVVATEPALDDIKAGKIANGFTVTLGTDADDAALSAAMDSLSSIATYEISRGAPAAPTESPPEPSTPSETEPVGEIVPPPPPADEAAVVPPPAEGAAPAAQETRASQTVRIRTQVLDDLIMGVGELFTARGSLATLAEERGDAVLRRQVDTLGNLIRDLHARVLNARMLPVSSIAGRFPRVVRDVARQAGKEVQFEITGDDIELDRAILERLTDPLIHILRNAVDHGLEGPEEREKAGKPRRGHVKLEARRERDLVAIRITDDGQGMDPTHLAEVAVAKGFLSPDEAEALTPEEAFLLTCMPGFSTAESVTFISGRGVGMDAVKSAIEEIGGTLSIASSLGMGTAVQLYLPRTIAIQNVLMVRVRKEVCAVPVSKLIRTVEVDTRALQHAQHTDHIVFDGEPIPVLDLSRLLHTHLPGAEGRGEQAVAEMDIDEEAPPLRAQFPALVVESKNRKYALAVDDLLGQHEAFIRPLGYPLQRIEGLSGVTTLGDGQTVFVIDTMALI